MVYQFRRTSKCDTIIAMVRIWVDDVRPPPNHTWLYAKNSREAFTMLFDCALSSTRVEHLALDHDLGIVGGYLDTTRNLVLMMCDNALPWPKHVSVHSSNPVGVEWLEGTIARYAPEGTLVSRESTSPPEQTPNFAAGK